MVEQLTPALVAQADVVTNSGHLRPLGQGFVDLLRPDAVVSLMMEAWEVDAGRLDVDLDALRRRGIAFAGTNERHPAVGVFDYLGVMAVKLWWTPGCRCRAPGLPAQRQPVQRFTSRGCCRAGGPRVGADGADERRRGCGRDGGGADARRPGRC